MNKNMSENSDNICFGCSKPGAVNEIEIMHTCQSCMGSDQSVIPEQKCHMCGGIGECWQNVNIHEACLDIM